MISLKSRILLVGCAGLLSLSACNAEENGKVAASVNGKPINESMVNVLVKERASQGQADSPELRKAILDDLIAREVVSQEAKKRNLDKSPEVAAQMQLASQGILVRTYLQDYVKNHPISESALKAEYDKIKATMGDKEYQARHILVANEADAKDIFAQLKKDPKKFEQLAKDKSKDPGSKAHGGELGWIALGNVVKPFGDALAKLKKGEISEPVQTQFGWHIIKLEDIRPLKAPPFDNVKDSLRQRLEQQEIQSVVADLRKQAKVEGADSK